MKLAGVVFGAGPRRIPEDVKATLLDPGGLLVALVPMVAYPVLAGRVWRVCADYRAVRAESPIPLDASESRLEWAAVVASVVLALVVAAVPGYVVKLARG